MPAAGTSFPITYSAFDFATNQGITGDVSNHTIKLIKDGVEFNPTNSPTEVDSLNLPGIYMLVVAAVDSAGGKLLVLAGKSSTFGVSITPETIELI